MSNFIFDKCKNKIHLIGIGGISMSALAKYLSINGFIVSGSDCRYGDDLEELKKYGIKVFNCHSAKNLNGVDAVIYSSAISEDNPELKRARRKKIPIYKRSEVLGAIAQTFSKTIAVSGSHGKTTATAMIAHSLICAGLNPTVFLGGESDCFSNFRKGGKNFIVLEACEYKKNFLDIKPDLSVVLNIDNDHLDSFGSMKEMQSAFSAFISGSVAIVNADDKKACSLNHLSTLTFGMEAISHYSARNIKFNGIGYSFSAYAYSVELGRINLSVIGKHNIYNALCAVAVCDYLKIPFSLTKSALENFKGVKRRAEYLGKFNNLDCFADYAHHPKEINATITAFLEQYDSLGVVFQPHTYSRTKYLMNDFVRELSKIDNLIIYKTYPAREKFDKEGSGYALYENLLNNHTSFCTYCESVEQLENSLSLISEKCSAVLFLGAGDIYEIAKSILKK